MVPVLTSGRRVLGLLTMTDVALVIFDCDGVLIDSELLSAQVLIEELARIGVQVDLAYFFRNCLGRHYSAVAECIARDTGHAIGADFETLYLRRLLEKFQSGLLPMSGARGVLAQLQIGYCVATNSNTSRAESALELAGISDLVGGRLISGSMVERGKPSPDLFLLAAARHGVEAPQCLVIEDSETGIAAAHAANMPVWRFTGGNHYKVGHRWMTTHLGVDKEFDDLSDFFRLLNER